MPAKNKAVRDKLERAMKKVHKQYGHRRNFTGVDVGYRWVEGEKTDELCVRVHVAQKLPLSEVPEAEVFPKEIDGIALDVISGPYRPGRLGSATQSTSRVPFLMGGISCGRPNDGAGTVGLIVINNETQRPAILSNWHVIAGAQARMGDAIMHPAEMDGGNTLRDTVASLSGWTLGLKGDAAIADINVDRPWLPLQFETFLQSGKVRRSRLGEVLTKSGRTTGVTRARVDGEGIYRLYYETQPGVHEPRDIEGFKLVAVTPGNPDDEEISAAGDSGAEWVSEGTGDIVGLHFGGETNPDPAAENALACNMDSVLTQLNARVATFEDLLALGAEATAPLGGAVPQFTPRPDTPDIPPYPGPGGWQPPLPIPPWWYHRMPRRGTRGHVPMDDIRTERAEHRRSIVDDLWQRLKAALIDAGYDVDHDDPRQDLSGTFPGFQDVAIRLRLKNLINDSPYFDGIGLPMMRSGDFRGCTTFIHVCEAINDVLAEV